MLCRLAAINSLRARAPAATLTAAPMGWHVSTQIRYHGEEHTGQRDKPIRTFWTIPNGHPGYTGKDGSPDRRELTAYEGQTLLDVAMEYDLPVEGACAGSCACSTCHVYLTNPIQFEAFPEASDEEEDMLDLAFATMPSSRLGCQVTLKQDTHQDLEVELPKATRNMAVDGYVAKPH